MNREERAKQFMPFDALKGLQNALRVKEYEHEKAIMGDISEEKIAKISKNLLELKNNSMVRLTYYENGYKIIFEGKIKVDFSQYKITTGVLEILFNDIYDLEIL